MPAQREHLFADNHLSEPGMAVRSLYHQAAEKNAHILPKTRYSDESFHHLAESGSPPVETSGKKRRVYFQAASTYRTEHLFRLYYPVKTACLNELPSNTRSEVNNTATLFIISVLAISAFKLKKVHPA